MTKFDGSITGSYGAGAEPLARCQPRVVLFLAGLPRVVQIRRCLVPALRPCGRIRNVIALPPCDPKSLSAALRQGRQGGLGSPFTEIRRLPSGLSVDESKQKNCYPCCQRA